MWDLGKFDATPFFIGFCEKGYRDNNLTVIGSFSARDEFRGKPVVSMACQGGCRLCDGTAVKFTFLVTLGNL